jgi:hypothetical protein
MKKLLSFTKILLLVCAHASAQQPSADEEARFTAAFRQAFETKNVEALLALVCWDGAPEANRMGLTRAFQSFVDEKLASVQIEPPSVTVEPEVTHGGRVYRMNLPIVRTIRFKTTDAKGAQLSDGSHQLGMKDGKLLMAQYAPLPEGRPRSDGNTIINPPPRQDAPVLTQ